MLLSCNKGLGILGDGKGWGTGGALGSPSIAFSVIQDTWITRGRVQAATL